MRSRISVWKRATINEGAKQLWSWRGDRLRDKLTARDWVWTGRSHGKIDFSFRGFFVFFFCTFEFQDSLIFVNSCWQFISYENYQFTVWDQLLIKDSSWPPRWTYCEGLHIGRSDNVFKTHNPHYLIFSCREWRCHSSIEAGRWD